MPTFYYNKDTRRVEPVTAEFLERNRVRPAPHATEALTYRNLRAPDGTDISSRRKHREYLEHHGLAMASDFKESGERYQRERVARLTGDANEQAIEQAVVDAYNKHEGV